MKRLKTMKRLIIVLCLFVSVIVNAEVLPLKLTQMCYKEEAYTTWSKWKECDIDAYWDIDEEQLVISSEKVQIIDYKEATVTKFKDYTLIKSTKATDSDYSRIWLELYIYNSGVGYIKVIYKDVEFKYKMYRNDN